MFYSKVIMSENTAAQVLDAEISTVTPTGNGADGLTVKTLEQNIVRNIKGQNFINFANEVYSGEWENMVGGKIEELTILPASEKLFSPSAFVQSDENFHVNGTGLLQNNRNEIDNLWTNAYTFEMVNPKNAKNIHYLPLNYQEGEYADILINQSLVSEAQSKVNNVFEIKKAQEIIFGADYKGKAGVTIHCNGLKDLIANAKSNDLELFDTVINDLTGYSHKYVSLSSSLDEEEDTSTDLEQFSRLNTLRDSGKDVSSCFCFGTTAADANAPLKYLTEGINDEFKLLIKTSSFNNLKAKNLQFYKELEQLYDQGLLIKLPMTYLDANFVENQTYVISRNIDFGVNGLNLADDELVLIQPKECFKKTYKTIKNSVNQLTVNNITDTRTVTDIWGFDYKPNGAVAVIKATKLFDLSEKIVP